MTMFLVGGGPTDGLGGVHDEFVAQARERGSRIGLALLGSAEEAEHWVEEYAAPIRERFADVEIVPIFLDDEPVAAENETVWPDDLEQLAGLVVAGGWTPGYLAALMPRRNSIARLVRGGAPYLGYSAGAMVAAKHALVGGWRFRGRQVAPEVWGEGLEEVELREGLGLVGITLDVHTDVLHLDRLVATLEQGQVHSAIAIDEDTCLVVDVLNGRTRVEGNQRIHWLTRESGATVIRHESSAAEKERHRAFLQAAAERAEAERAEAERAEAERQTAARAEAASQQTTTQESDQTAHDEASPTTEAQEVPPMSENVPTTNEAGVEANLETPAATPDQVPTTPEQVEPTTGPDGDELLPPFGGLPQGLVEQTTPVDPFTPEAGIEATPVRDVNTGEGTSPTQ